MTPPLWMICIPTVPTRAASLQRLLHRLLPQVAEWSGAVQVVGWLNAGEPRLAEIRDAMMDGAAAAGAEYVSFLDDDDMVSIDFVQRIMVAMFQQGASPDHVGFQVEYWKDGKFLGFVEHSLKHRKWGMKRDALGQVVKNEYGYVDLVRDFTHIDPIRTELAAQGRFSQARRHQAEDRVWCRQIRGLLKTEAYIPRPLYQYFWAPSASVWDAHDKLAAARAITHLPRIPVDHPYFSWHPNSL